MEKETSRIEALSDGVFGVAITLLAVELGLDIRDIEAHHAIESTSNPELLHLLFGLWPKIFTYFNSFASVLLMWMFHHQLFKLVRSIDTRLMLCNGLLLLFVALVPLPTKTMGEFIFTDAFRSATLFYTGYSILVAFSFLILSFAIKAKNGRLLLPDLPAGRLTGLSRGLWMGFLLNTGIFILAFFEPAAALILNFCMWIFWAFLAGISEVK